MDSNGWLVDKTVVVTTMSSFSATRYFWLTTFNAARSRELKFVHDPIRNKSLISGPCHGYTKSNYNLRYDIPSPRLQKKKFLPWWRKRNGSCFPCLCNRPWCCHFPFNCPLSRRKSEIVVSFAALLKTWNSTFLWIPHQQENKNSKTILRKETMFLRKKETATGSFCSRTSPSTTWTTKFCQRKRLNSSKTLNSLKTWVTSRTTSSLKIFWNRWLPEGSIIWQEEAGGRVPRSIQISYYFVFPMPSRSFEYWRISSKRKQDKRNQLARIAIALSKQSFSTSKRLL